MYMYTGSRCCLILLQFMCFPQISPVARVFKDFSRVDVEYCYTQVVNFTIVEVIGSLSFVEAS